MDRTQYAALKPLMQDIALQLTKITAREWTVRKAEADETMYFHIDSGNAELYITTAYNAPNRLAINGTTPRGNDRQYVRVYEQRMVDGKPQGWDEFKFSSITVSASKSAATIAQDIQRRFMPDYLKAVQLTVNRIDRDNEYASKRRENLEAVAATVGEVLRSDYRPIHGCDPVLEPVTNFHHYFGNDSSGIRIEVNADNKDVDLKLANLTVAEAQKVAHLVSILYADRRS